MRRHAWIVAAAVATALTGAGAADASVFAGHSGWFWGDPLPQGNTLRAIDFAGTRGYAVGDFGTVLRSDDDGTTWRGLTTGTTAPLRLVRAISQDSLVVAGGCDVRRSDDGGRSFTSLPWMPASAACRRSVAGVAFPSATVGFLVLADGGVVRTRDGGKTWSARTAIPGTRVTTRGSQVRPTDVVFTAPDTGFVTADSGAIYRTTDGGISWSPVGRAAGHLASLWFVDPQTGFAVGGNEVLTTRDGGTTWTDHQALVGDEDLDWIRCNTTTACTAATTRGDQLLRTDDAGESWTPISPASQPLFAAGYSTSGALVAVGQAGTTVASPDGGHNFAAVSEGLGAAFTRITVAGDVAFAAGRSGAIARTLDGGGSWTLLSPPADDDIVDLSFADENTGFELGPNNSLMRTDDGGQTWRLLDIGTFVEARRLIALDDKTIGVVMLRGLRFSYDGGLNFARVRSRAVAMTRFSGIGRGGKLVFAYGRHGLATSGDSGRTWRAAPLPERHGTLSKVDFPTPDVAYALTGDGRAWRSSDAAHSWHELPGLGTDIASDIAFADPGSGWVSVREFGDNRGGYVMRTINGGQTWWPQLVDSKPIAGGGLAATSSETAFALSGNAHLLATNRGGDLGQRSTLTLSATRTRPGRPGVIAIRGTLAPAEGGEAVVVSERIGRSSRWLFRTFTASSTGRFSVFAKLTRTTQFVAQWTGDDERAGAGTSVLTVGVGKRYTQRKLSASS